MSDNNKPELSGRLQDNRQVPYGSIALWVISDDDKTKKTSPDFTGNVNINADRVAELLEANPNASEISLRVAVWRNK